MTTNVPVTHCDLGPAIKAALGLRRWTQAQLAEAAGLTQGGVSDICRRGWGHHDSIRAICAVLDIQLVAELGQPELTDEPPA